MLEFSNKDFKAAIVKTKMLLQGIPATLETNEKLKNFIKEIENIKKQRRILELKNAINKKKTQLD